MTDYGPILKHSKIFDSISFWLTGDLKESFYIGPLDDEACNLNQWPSKGIFCYYVCFGMSNQQFF